MKLRITKIVAGPEGGAQPGQVVDWPAARALPLIEAGGAVSLEEPAPPPAPQPEPIVETAGAKPVAETAATTRGPRGAKAKA